MSEALAPYLPWIVLANFGLVAVVLLLLGRLVTARPLTERPGAVQNAAELALDWFVEQARRVHPAKVTLVAPFLATLFLMILLSNLLAVLPVPVLQVPPTAWYSGPLALALVSVFGGLALGTRIRGGRAALKHLFWPNPLQLVGEASHVLSLSLRLYGNIGGEYIVAGLAAAAAPWGIPLIIHALGLIPAVIQPLVFTLLTVTFLSTAVHADGARERRAAQVRALAGPTPTPPAP